MVYHFSHLEFVKHYVRMTESNFPGSSKLFERAMLNLINQIKSIPANIQTCAIYHRMFVSVLQKNIERK